MSTNLSMITFANFIYQIFLLNNAFDTSVAAAFVHQVIATILSTIIFSSNQHDD